MTDINDTAVAREIAELRAENERLRKALQALFAVHRNGIQYSPTRKAGIKSVRDIVRRDELYQQARQALKGGKG